MSILEESSTIRSELNSDERLLWTGSPRRGLRFRAQDVFLVPFTFIWGGGVIFMFAQPLFGRAWSSGLPPAPRNMPPIFLVFEAVFLCVAAYITVGRFIVDAWQRGHTLYGLTDQRIVIIRRAPTRQVKSLPLASLPEISINERRDGSGTITFGSNPFPFGMAGGTSMLSRYLQPGFEMIPNVRQVYRQILAAMHKDTAG